MVKKYKLLIIDDNEELLFAISSFLKSRGHAVFTAKDGLEGLKIIENKKSKFDLLITDLVMPHVSGVGLISLIKKKFPDFPVIAITGWGDFPEALAAEAKADCVMKKPFKLEELESRITEILEPGSS